MEDLLVFLNSIFANELQVRVIFISLITLAFFGFGMAAALVVAGLSDPLRRRLLKLTGNTNSSIASRLTESLQPVSEYILPGANKERTHIQALLVHAGFRTPNSLTMFYAIKTVAAIALPAIILLGAALFPTLTTRQVLMFAMMSAGVGVFMPNIYLRHMVNKRKKLLRAGFPDALDLLVVCVESGLGLASAIQRVAEELSVSHGELSSELTLVNSEIRAGIDRSSALKNLAERTGLKDIRGLVTLLSQSMRFGTSIADTLRVYAEEFRDKRMQLAEEQAAKIGTKLIFPLVLCLFPAFFVVAIGPAILKILVALNRI